MRVMLRTTSTLAFVAAAASSRTAALSAVSAAGRCLTSAKVMLHASAGEDFMPMNVDMMVVCG